jgi:hypothetical protein
MEKAKKWAEYVRTGHLRHVEAWTCLEVTIMNTLNYSLPATNLSKQELEQVMKPILEIGLPRSGVCRKLARAVVFAPRRYLGLGLKHPYVT